jgi:DNA polymerase
VDPYAPENLVWFDFETRSPVPIKAGAYRYAVEADAVLLAYAIGLGPTQLVDRGGAALCYADLPAELREAFVAGQIFCGWNTNFDRSIWGYALRDSPFLAPGQVIDARATALAHNLPDDLETASTRLGGPGKQKDGKILIARFCGSKAVLAAEDPEAWERFCTYAKRDVDELRRVFRLMLPALTAYDWSVYQANEVINDRGADVDLVFCREAARLAAEDEVRTGARLAVLTGGAIDSIHQNLRIAQFVHDRLPTAEARLIMSTVYKEEASGEKDEDLVEKVKLTVKRGVVERLLDYLRTKGCDDTVLMEVLELREFGASAAPKKFKAILDSHVDGRLYGQFQFNGAGQTGRFSGKGVQLQNLTRSVLGQDPGDDYGLWEESTVAMIADGCSLEELAAHGLGEVPARKLALTIRPAFIARGDRTLIKSDYSQIEARVLPWLAHSPGAEALLESFRRADRDPNAPDLYKVTAAGMLGKTPETIAKEERQTGKVAVLACGYGGGRNALHSMAANYRMHFSDAEAQAIVDRWRAANAWAPEFWGKHSREGSYGLYGAARRAMENPQTLMRVGRVAFIYAPLRRDGMLFCILPSGRPLVYPGCRMRDYDIVDKTTKRVLETRHGLTFRRARGIIALYGGRFAENVTQAVAADLLREALVRMVEMGLDVVTHAHDEIVVECARRDIEATTAAMQEAMTFDRPWAEGLPLAVDMTERWYYSAAKKDPTADAPKS